MQEFLLKFVDKFGTNAESDFRLFVLSLLVVLSYLLARSIARWREDTLARLDECEDAHILRDGIQIEQMNIISEFLGALREEAEHTYDPSNPSQVLHRRKIDKKLQTYESRAKLVEIQIKVARDRTIEQREEYRKERRKSKRLNITIGSTEKH